MPGVNAGYRNRLLRGVHAEGLKRGFDHDGLRDLCRERFKVHSMSDMRETHLLALYREWTGKGLKRRGTLPRAGEAAASAAVEIVSGEDLIALQAEFARREWGPEARETFIARQLTGRREIRTRRDYVRVMAGVRAMNRRDGL